MNRFALEAGLMDAPAVVRGAVRATPRALRLTVRAGPCGAVLALPVAGRVERHGRTRHLPVVDITRLLVVGLALLAAAALFGRRRG